VTSGACLRTPANRDEIVGKERRATMYLKLYRPEAPLKSERRCQNAVKTKKDLLNHEPNNTSNSDHRHHHSRIDAERQTAQNGSKLPEPSKPGLCAMEGGAESKETITRKDANVCTNSSLITYR
jgi:hypothetical protein